MSTLINRKAKFILILIMSLLFCVCAIIFEANELIQNQVYFIQSFGREQELLVAQTVYQAKNMLIDKKETDNDVIEKIIKNSVTSGNRYWFFSKDNKVLFYKNAYEMEQMKIKDVHLLLNSLKTNNGNNIGALVNLSGSKTNSSVLFSSSKNGLEVLASIYFFEANGAEYSLGICTTKNYILSEGKITKHNTYLVIVMVAVCLVLFSAIIFSLTVISKKNDEILICKKNIYDMNIKIEKLTEENPNEDVLYNDDTKLYEREVLDALLKKLTQPELYPISMLVISVSYSKKLTYNDMILKLTPAMHRLLPQKSVAARTQDNQVALLLFMTEYKTAKAFQANLIKLWSGILKKSQFSVKTEVITHSSQPSAPIDKFEYWISSGQVEKERVVIT